MRIVSLLPSASEIVGALGLGEHLVAVSHECDQPPEVSSLPKATGSVLPHGLTQAEIDRQVSEAVKAGTPLYGVDGALLRELQPDLIVTQAVCDVCAVSPSDIHSALGGVPADVLSGATIVALSGTSFAGVLDDIRTVGRAAGVDDRAHALVSQLQGRWDQVRESAEGGGTKIAMLEWSDPPFSGGHWVPEQVEAAGGIDVLGAVGVDSRRLRWSEVVDADPDIVCLVACGYGVEDNAGFARDLQAHPEAGRLRAVREGRLWALDANRYFSRPATGLARGLELLHHIVGGGADLPGEAMRIPPR